MSSLKEVQQIINQLGIDHLPEVRKVIRAVLLRSLIIHHHALSERAPPPDPYRDEASHSCLKEYPWVFFRSHHFPAYQVTRRRFYPQRASFGQAVITGR